MKWQERARKLKSNGIGTRQIVETLNKEGFKTITGKSFSVSNLGNYGPDFGDQTKRFVKVEKRKYSKRLSAPMILPAVSNSKFMVVICNDAEALKQIHEVFAA